MQADEFCTLKKPQAYLRVKVDLHLFLSQQIPRQEHKKDVKMKSWKNKKVFKGSIRNYSGNEDRT